MLETAAQVVGNGFGGGALDPSTPLSAFVRGTLLLGADAWAAACPAALARAATLAHLRDLLLQIEARGLGRAGSACAAAFRDPLPPAFAAQLAAFARAALGAAPDADAEIDPRGSGEGGGLWPVLGPLRDLLTGALADPSEANPTASLKAYLGYQDDDLTRDANFAQAFPEALPLAHAHAAYFHLAHFAGDPVA